MDGNTPINVFERQFSQREASELAGTPMPTINNWLKRGAFKLPETEPASEGTRRRFFSIADIAKLHAMRFCTEHLEISPEAAAIASSGIADYFAGNIREIVTDDGTQFDVWHWAHRAPAGSDGSAVWTAQGVWMNPATGAFYQYHPGLFGDDEPGGPPHFPCICVPTSELARRIFLACADRLIAEHPDDEASHRRETDGNLSAGASCPGPIEGQ